MLICHALRRPTRGVKIIAALQNSYHWPIYIVFADFSLFSRNVKNTHPFKKIASYSILKRKKKLNWFHSRLVRIYDDDLHKKYYTQAFTTARKNIKRYIKRE